MTEQAHNIDIDAVEARRDELTREYADIRRSLNEAISAIPADAPLRDMNDRRDRVARDTVPADRIGGETPNAAWSRTLNRWRPVRNLWRKPRVRC